MPITDSKNSKKFIFLIGLLFVAVIIIFILLNRLWRVPGPEDFLADRPDLAEEARPRITQETELDEGAKEVVNTYDGYRLVVPAHYTQLDPELRESPLIIFYDLDVLKRVAQELQKSVGELEEFDLLQEPPILSIITRYKDPRLNLLDWLSQNLPDRNFQQDSINQRLAYKSSSEPEGEEGELQYTAFESTYVLESDVADTIFMLTCSAENEEKISECETAVRTFELL